MQMKAFYAIQPTFYDYIKNNRAVLSCASDFSLEQQQCMLVFIEMKDVLASAVSYFQKDIYMEKNCLFYEHFLKSEIFVIEGKDGGVLIDNLENPFYLLLKRKYRYFLVMDIE